MSDEHPKMQSKAKTVIQTPPEGGRRRIMIMMEPFCDITHMQDSIGHVASQEVKNYFRKRTVTFTSNLAKQLVNKCGSSAWKSKQTSFTGPDHTPRRMMKENVFEEFPCLLPRKNEAVLRSDGGSLCGAWRKLFPPARFEGHQCILITRKEVLRAMGPSLCRPIIYEGLYKESQLLVFFCNGVLDMGMTIS